MVNYKTILKYVCFTYFIKVLIYYRLNSCPKCIDIIVEHNVIIMVNSHCNSFRFCPQQKPNVQIEYAYLAHQRPHKILINGHVHVTKFIDINDIAQQTKYWIYRRFFQTGSFRHIPIHTQYHTASLYLPLV